ncbi:MAG: hypothetical protein GX536_08030 [Actinobacteria bacterium]|nr:hypothetical protein [Actinomycetota bacterium]
MSALHAEDVPSQPAARVQMIDTRAWEEQGLLVLRGPGQTEGDWLEMTSAEAYAVEHIAGDIADAAPPYTDVVALAARDPGMPLLYYLVTPSTLARLAAG